MPRIPFLSLVPEGDAARELREAVERVISRGWFVLGPELEAFEAEFAAASGAARAVGVGTGTDAIALILRALGIGPGDEVITTPLSAAYTALAVMMVGARPVFADIDPSRLTLDPEQVARAIGPRTRAILPVHLYGQAADMAALERLASRHGLALVEDCCQAHLGTAAGRPVGTIGVAGAFSFYPTKNLGALGDGGAVITNDPSLADRIKRLRNGGQVDRYRHDAFGVNSRLDEMQAAVLRARLPRLAGWTARRRALAAALPIGARLRSGGRSEGTRCRARLPSVRRPGPRPRRAAGATRGRRHRNARPLPDPDPAPACDGRREPSRLPRGGARLRRGVVAAAASGPDRRRGCRRRDGAERTLRVRALITGGAGFIGSHLAEALLERGDTVLVLDNLSTGSIDNITHLKGRAKFEYFVDTVENEPLLAELIDRSDVVFHFAAAVGVKLIVEQPVHTIETNVHGTEVVLKHANKKKKLVVIASTSEVYGKSEDVPFREDSDLVHGADDEAPLGLRVQQGHRRVPGARVLERAEAPRHRRPILQHRRTAPDRPVRDGDSELRPAGAGRAGRSPCSATAASRVPSRTWRTWSARS